MNNKKDNHILHMSLDQIMSDRFARYSKYIIQGRALPDARDGLKPVQRRILFSMSELGLLYNKPFKKSARVVGDVIGKYHPHGDSSIYEAMVRMSQSWKMNMPLIEMHGNNGSIDDDPAAAMRYTEARLERISDYMLDGIRKDTVKFAPNFDDSEREPTVLPGLIPNLLINGARGIAAGYATEMPPHNLVEVINTIITKIKSPNASLNTMLKTIKGPDFPTGGIVMGYDGIYSAFERGRGKIVIRSKYEVSTSKTKPFIKISEIPYGVVKSKLVRQLASVQYDKKISGIKEVRDESDRDGISIMIELNKDTDSAKILTYLLAKTELQIYYNYNNIAIKDNAPVLMGLGKLIDAYLNHQTLVQRNALNFNLQKDTKRLEIVQGLIKVSEIADKVIAVIRNAPGSKSGVVEALINTFNFTKLQADAIADLRLYRLSRTDQSIYIEERNNLNERITRYELLLSDQKEFSKNLIHQLKEVKKIFGHPRKSEVVNELETLIVNEEELIQHEDVWVGVSKKGYIKKFSNRSFEANEVSTYGLKEEDMLIYFHKINTSDKLLVFTSEGRYMYLPVHQIEEVKFKTIGKHLNDFVSIHPDEELVDAISVNSFDLNAYIVLVTAKGKAKRTLIKSFSVKRYSSAMTAMKLDEHDKLIGAKPSNGHMQVIIINKLGKAVKYLEHQLTTQGTKTGGAIAIKLSGEDRVTTFVLASQSDMMGLISQRGGVKKIKVTSIAAFSKTTQGKQIYNFVKGNTHYAIDAAVVEKATQAAFKYDGPTLSIVKMKNVNITSTNEGFSKLGPAKTTGGKILKFNRIHTKSRLFHKIDNVSEEQTFEDAEKLIDDVSPVSIDDLLKDI
ncbi:DNA topoisomerase IV subunit A [Candidatus Mycoplasma mahonii]|uniref:DNA topoisomerase IV subunit A n=1 Tax=Candidatus Mycoplasma mahonii TaxID=3004105 RepID=UPI0026EC71F1|nr:DNA topoisomerase IV subunit A [Candidatus Mycoplasma mahonii]WKX02197.1 DNA topoisomerase IV subunit A [Candidatus Mycoplasma mahonii]